MDFTNQGRPGRWRPTESKGPRWAQELAEELEGVRRQVEQALEVRDLPGVIRNRLRRLVTDADGLGIVARLFASGDLQSGEDFGGAEVSRG